MGTDKASRGRKNRVGGWPWGHVEEIRRLNSECGTNETNEGSVTVGSGGARKRILLLARKLP